MLEEYGEGLWYAEAPVSFLGTRIVTRMSVVRLSDGGVMAISPLILDDALRREIDAIGPVRHIASPNKIHNQGLESFARAWPEAKLWASPGLVERRPDLAFAGVLGDAPEPGWALDLDQATTRGNVFFSEVVFLHRKSRTLIVADLVENLNEAAGLTAWGRFAAQLMRIYGRPLPSPEFRFYTDDAEAAASSLDRIADWPFDRILLAHGAFVESGAKEVFRTVRDFLVTEVSRRPRWRKALYRWMATWQ